MIHFATSYFYQIRFFRPDMIPLSTARFDPSWYHRNKGHNFTLECLKTNARSQDDLMKKLLSPLNTFTYHQ